MAEVQAPTGASARDTALMALSVLVLLGGVVAFYWYDEWALPLRVALVVAGVAVAAGLMRFTWYCARWSGRDERRRSRPRTWCSFSPF
jgi:uncharacterized membrane-anchored protein